MGADWKSDLVAAAKSIGLEVKVRANFTRYVKDSSARSFFNHLKDLQKTGATWGDCCKQLSHFFTTDHRKPDTTKLREYVSRMVKSREAPNWYCSFYAQRNLAIFDSIDSRADDSAVEFAEVEIIQARPAPVPVELPRLPEPVTDASLMIFRDTKIRMRGEQGAEQMCLTDMWRANGSDLAKRPNNWIDSAAAVALREFLADSEEARNSGSLVSAEKGNPRIGDGGSTWAHWQLAFAYAKYLSPAFHAWVNQAAREKMTRVVAIPAATTLAAPADLWTQIRLVAGGMVEVREGQMLLAQSISETRDDVGELQNDVRQLKERPLLLEKRRKPQHISYKEAAAHTGLPRFGVGAGLIDACIERACVPSHLHGDAVSAQGIPMRTIHTAALELVEPYALVVKTTIHRLGATVSRGQLAAGTSGLSLGTIRQRALAALANSKPGGGDGGGQQVLIAAE